MLVRQAFRFKARASAAQAAYCHRVAGICRTLYNAALEQRTTAWARGRQRVGYQAQAAELADLKAAQPWISEAPHHCLQQALRDLDRAFVNFFKKRAAYPAFHKKGRHRGSFRFPDATQITLKQPADPRGRRGRIKLPKIGWLSYVVHRPVEGAVKQVTLVCEADGWYVSILAERTVPDPVPNDGWPVALDRGVASTVALSEGRGRFSVPVATAGEQGRMRRLQQRLARQRKGSRGRQKTKTALARLHQRVRRRRTDALHRLSFHLAQTHSQVFVEALDVAAMTASARGTVAMPGRRVRQKAGLNRAILAQGWGELTRQLQYKGAWYGASYVALADYAYSSQDCAVCGYRDAGNRVTQAVFRCGRCLHTANADDNAADNLLARGLRVTAGGALRSRAGDEAGISVGAALAASPEAPSFRAG